MRCGGRTIGAVALLLATVGQACAAPRKAPDGTFRVCADSPAYFSLGDRPTALVGDYTWGAFSDRNFDYVRYFDSLHERGINLARVWLWWGCEELVGDAFGYPHVEPYLRPGPGTANDGKPKYDLSKPNPEFYERLSTFCQTARDRDIELQLIAMDAWMLKHAELWRLHAFQRDNNVNGVDGDPADTGQGTDGERGFCSTGNPRAMEFQKALVARIVDTTNEFPNVHYEIANENYYSEEWELALCDYIKEYERTKPRQHLTMRRDLPSHSYVVQTWDPATVRKGMMERRSLGQPLLFDTDWIINDSDDEVRKAMWTALASGGSFSYMDDSLEFRHGEPYTDKREALHAQIDHAAAFMRLIRPWEMEPSDKLVTAGAAYAMASSTEFVAYLTDGGDVTLDLGGMRGPISARWYNPRAGEWSDAVRDGDGLYTAPDQEDWVLLLRGD